MDKIIFNETNIYILSKLVSMVRHENGSRHRLSSEESVTSLLQEVSRSPNQEIQSLFKRFLGNLHPKQIKIYGDQGVIIPEGVTQESGILPPPVKRQYAFVN